MPRKTRTDQPHPVDVAVGRRVRMLRIMREMTQEALADELDVSFQQLQKYEKGTNRISASKLYEMSVALDVPPGLFFGDKNDFEDIPDLSMKHLTSEDMRFLMAYEGLIPDIRKHIRALAYAIEAWVGQKK